VHEAEVKPNRAWYRYGPLGLIVLVLGLLVVSRGMAWHEWIVGDARQTSGLGGPRLPRAPLAATEEPDDSESQIQYVFGEWQGQDAIPGGMVVYMLLLSVSGALCWATLARVLPSHTTLEIAYLVVVVGMLVWLGVLPFLWFWIAVRSGLVGSTIGSVEVLIIPLDVTLVRLRLLGPLTLLASVLVSLVAFVWERMGSRKEAHRADVRQA
jgi:hypothetical protein